MEIMTVRNTTTSELKEGKLVKKKAVKGTEPYTMSIMNGTIADFFRFITFMTRLMLLSRTPLLSLSSLIAF